MFLLPVRDIGRFRDFAALAAKRGDKAKSELRGASKEMAKSMSEKELEKMASTKQKGKPEHKSKS
ncbi:DUF3008 family protein [Brucella intermedia]|uniref:DUF3008 family protein n=1 Tax=Brucella intermedia TaxID=94625 RepID=UPI0023628908|nr:DUF3008 family protein [Brucella intermedia]